MLPESKTTVLQHDQAAHSDTTGKADNLPYFADSPSQRSNADFAALGKTTDFVATTAKNENATTDHETRKRRKAKRDKAYKLRDAAHDLVWSFVDRHRAQLESITAAQNTLGSAYNAGLVDSDGFRLQSVALHEHRAKTAKKAKRQRLTACGKVIPEHRDNAELNYSTDAARAFYSGLAVCDDIRCPVCAPKRAELTGRVLAKLFNEAAAQGYYVNMNSFTLQHSRGDSLAERLGQLVDSLRGLKQQRSYRALAERYGFLTEINVLEVTHGSNGHHPHKHICQLRDYIAAVEATKTAVSEAGRVLDKLRGRWSAANERALTAENKAADLQAAASAAAVRMDAAPVTAQRAADRAQRAADRAADLRSKADDIAAQVDWAADDLDRLQADLERAETAAADIDAAALLRRADAADRRAEMLAADIVPLEREIARFERAASRFENEAARVRWMGRDDSLQVSDAAEQRTEADKLRARVGDIRSKIAERGAEAARWRAEAVTREAGQSVSPQAAIQLAAEAAISHRMEAGRLKDDILPLYLQQLEKRGAWCNDHGLDVSTRSVAEERVAEYLAKFGELPSDMSESDVSGVARSGLAGEAARGAAKQSRAHKGASMLNLLERAADGDEAAAAAWLEYWEATQGKHFINGLARVAELLGLCLDDLKADAAAELAAELAAESGEVVPVCDLDQSDMNALARARYLSRLLGEVETAAHAGRDLVAAARCELDVARMEAERLGQPVDHDKPPPSRVASMSYAQLDLFAVVNAKCDGKVSRFGGVSGLG